MQLVGRGTSDRSARRRSRSSDRARTVGAVLVAIVTMLVATATILAGGAVPAGGAEAAPNPLTCEGYPQPRLFLESQAWWLASPGRSGTSFGHVHSGTCFPYRQTVSGQLTLHVRSMLHENVGTLTHVRVQAYNKGAYSVKTLKTVSQSFRCPSTTPDDCTTWTTVTVDTSLLPYDGLTEFRVHSQAKEPDGNIMLASTGWLAKVRNGKPYHDTTYLNASGTVQTEGRGWYGHSFSSGDNLGYANARFLSALPTAPVSGTWSPAVQTIAGADGKPITHTLVTINPQFHAAPANRGWVQVERNAAWRGTLAVDTTMLPNGPHRLGILASADQSVGSRQTGVQIIPFTVQN